MAGMRIQDARPGDVLRDASGDLWVCELAARKVLGPFCHGENDTPLWGEDLADLDNNKETFPFVRLVPEVTQ